MDGHGHTTLQKAVALRLPRSARLLVEAGADWLAPTGADGPAQRAAPRLSSPLLLLAKLCNVPAAYPCALAACALLLVMPVSHVLQASCCLQACMAGSGAALLAARSYDTSHVAEQGACDLHNNVLPELVLMQI